MKQSRGLQELTNDRLGAEADLTRLLGTLRYLHSLKAARQQVESVAAAASSQSTPEQHEASASATPGQTFELYARQMCMLYGGTVVYLHRIVLVKAVSDVCSWSSA